jgi:hypothetical protein
MGEEAKKVVPFGKYRGQPLEVLEADPGYVQWLQAQDWVAQRYPTFHTLIINNLQEPSETPEHNALQVRFLSERFQRQVWEAWRAKYVPGPHELPYRAASDIQCVFEEHGIDVLLNINGNTNKLAIELKPTLGDDYPAVLRQIKAWRTDLVGYARSALMIDAFTARGATLDQVRQVFALSHITLLTLAEVEAQEVPDAAKDR